MVLVKWNQVMEDFDGELDEYEDFWKELLASSVITQASSTTTPFNLSTTYWTTPGQKSKRSWRNNVYIYSFTRSLLLLDSIYHEA